MLVEANSAQQLIELPIEAIDCLLARLQLNLIGFGSDADAEKFVGALDNLQRLSKIVAGLELRPSNVCLWAIVKRHGIHNLRHCQLFPVRFSSGNVWGQGASSVSRGHGF
jgi:hypothetical protein